MALGTHDTWQQPGVFAVEKHLQPGKNVIAVRAENRSAPVQRNPAGLIAWVDSCGVYTSEEDLRALGDPDSPGIDRLPIRPRVATAPVIERP